jgi:hypothetical protein
MIPAPKKIIIMTSVPMASPLMPSELIIPVCALIDL